MGYFLQETRIEIAQLRIQAGLSNVLAQENINLRRLVKLLMFNLLRFFASSQHRGPSRCAIRVASPTKGCAI